MDEQESDLSIPPSRLSFKKWFLLSTGILLAAISIPLLFNTDNYIKRLNSEMVSIRLFSKSLLWPSVTLGLLTSQRVFVSLIILCHIDFFCCL